VLDFVTAAFEMAAEHVGEHDPAAESQVRRPVQAGTARIERDCVPVSPPDDDKLFHKSIALPVALQFPSAEALRQAGAHGIARHLNQIHVSFQTRTIDRIVAWAGTAAEPSELTPMYTRQWQQLNQVRQLWDEQFVAAEREMAGFLVKTPYLLLLSVTGINVVSAARLAGEAGPIEHYASARALNGRAGLFPSRYQSDEVDHADRSLVRQCNRKLRGAAILVAENLIKCHPYYRGLSELWKQRKVDPRDRRCRVANRAMRMVYQLAAKKHRGPKHIGELLIPLLIRLGVSIENAVESNTSEARSSD
jgi:hypothetical protein